MQKAELKLQGYSGNRYFLDLSIYTLKWYLQLTFVGLEFGCYFEIGFLCVALAILELSFVDQTILELTKYTPASASGVLGLN